jgi:hypothetical protein
MPGDLVEAQEGWRDRDPALRATFAAYTLDDGLEGRAGAFVVTRNQTKREDAPKETAPSSPPDSTAIEDGGGVQLQGEASKKSDAKQPDVIEEGPSDTGSDELDMIKPTAEYWGAMNPPSNIHISMDAAFKTKGAEAYQVDPEFSLVLKDAHVDAGIWRPGQRFFKNDEGQLFFRDADYQPRLCVPRTMDKGVLEEAHESPMGAAHISPERLWGKISSKFYWRRMKKDIEEFCDTLKRCT